MRPYRSGWIITDAPGGRYATRNGRTLHQGSMNYHQFITALDRIAGFVCWEDILVGLRNGLPIEIAHERAVFTETEAWLLAERLATGASQPQQPPPERPLPTPAPERNPPQPTPSPPQGAAHQQALFALEDQ